MARVTVEDCLEKVPNKFELVLLSARRARDLESGVSPSVPRDNDKNTIIALREIAEETISLDGLRALTKKGIAEIGCDEDDFSANVRARHDLDEEVDELLVNESEEDDLADEEEAVDDQDVESHF